MKEHLCLLIRQFFASSAKIENRLSISSKLLAGLAVWANARLGTDFNPKSVGKINLYITEG